MQFDWREFLQVARVLATDAIPSVGDEAAKRTAVGRAYYAAFGHARQQATAEGFGGLESAEDHVMLRDHFERTGRRDIARILNRLRQWRNQADYQTSVDNLQLMTKESLAESQRLVNRLNP